MIQPGEVYMADFGPAGPHPVIVVSREDLNRGHFAFVVVCLGRYAFLKLGRVLGTKVV